MNKFFTKMFCIALLFALGAASVNAQLVTPQTGEVTLESKLDVTRPPTDAELELGYSNAGTGTYAGYNIAANSTLYVSGCISFSEGQMYNYIGGSLHTIEVGIPPLMSGVTNLMGNLTSFRVWIKNTLDGAVVYEEDVFTQVELGAYNLFLLATPYPITSAPLVLGYTAGFTNTTAAAFPRYPLWAETQYPPYPEAAYHGISNANVNYHGAGATWSVNTGRALNVWGHVTGNPLPTNDLCAIGVNSTPLKWVDNPTTYTVIVFNGGTASQNNYSVQLLDAADNVLATQAVTTTIAAGAFANITVNYTPTTAGSFTVKGKVILTGDQSPGNDISGTMTQKIYPQQPMAYCTYANDGGYGATINPAALHATIGYTSSQIAPHVGKQLTAIDVCLPVDVTNLTDCSVWIRNSTTGTDLYTQSFTPTVNGWNSVTLTTPYTLQNANTFIGFTVNTVSTASCYPLTYSLNSPADPNGGHFAINTSWYTLAGQNVTGNMNIIGTLEGESAPPPPPGDCDDVPVISGTTSTLYGPVYFTYNNSYDQQIYDASEIGGAGQITKLSYNYVYTTAKTVPAIIYLGHTTKSGFDGTTAGDFVPSSELQLVYTGSVAFSNANQWTEIILDTPFDYNGTDNLVVAFVCNRLTGWQSANHFMAGSTSPTYKNIYSYDDTLVLTPDNMGSATGRARQYDRANIQFEVCAPGGTVICDDVPVISGTTSTLYGPVYFTYNNSYDQQIYDASEIGGAGKITKLSYNYVYTTAKTVPAIIYLGHTTKSDFGGTTAGDFVPSSELQLVYTGSVAFSNANQWTEIILDTPFDYNGTDNLVVAFVCNRLTGWQSASHFMAGSTSPLYKNIYSYDDNLVLTPDNMGSATGRARQYDRANIQFEVCTGSGGPCVPTDFQVGDNPTTNTQYYPVWNWWYHSYSQFIYDEADLDIGSITSLSLEYNYTSTLTRNYVTVYLGTTTKNQFGSVVVGEYIPVGELQAVWTGDLSYAAGTYWQAIEFDVPFNYTGGNLVVALLCNDNAYSLTPRFNNTATTVCKSLQGGYDSGVAIDPANPPAPSTTYSGNYRPNMKFNICVGGGSGDCLPPTNLVAAYNGTCEVNLTWDAPGGKSLSTPIGTNGSGGVAFDVIAGAEDVTITAVEVPFTNVGLAAVHVYHKSGTACGNATNPAVWTYDGQTDVQITVTGNGNWTFVNMPTPILIPAGQTVGLYISTFGASGTPGAIRYVTGGSTCGTTTLSGSNAELTVKGGHGITTPLAPFGGTINSERNFEGKIHYTTGSGSVPNSYKVYRDNALVTTVTTTSYTDTGNNPALGNTWKVTGVCTGIGETTGIEATLGVCPDLPTCMPKIVGTGTATTYEIPMNTFYRYSYVQHIYDAAELSGPGYIINIAFPYIYTVGQKRDDFRIYMGNTTQSTFSGTANWIPLSQLQLVRSGYQWFDNTGTDNWVTMEIDAFEYTGGNLVVAILNNEGDYYTSSSPTFRYTVATGNKTIQYRVDGTTPIDPASPPTATGVTANRTNAKFLICSEIPSCDDPASNLQVEYQNDCAEAVLTWNPPAKGGKSISAPVIGKTEPQGKTLSPEEILELRQQCERNIYGQLPDVFGPTEEPIIQGGDAKAYPHDAYVWGSPASGVYNYSSINLATGAKTQIVSQTSPPFATGEDYDGTSVYRAYENGLIVKVNEDGTFTNVGTITGLKNFPIGLAYDWVANDGSWYFSDIEQVGSNFIQDYYKLSIPSLTKTLIGSSPAIYNIIYRGLTIGSDGSLYAVACNFDYYSISNLVKISKTNGSVSTVGSLGFPVWYGMDLEVDRTTGTLYGGVYDWNMVQYKFGTISTTNGAFSLIQNYGAYGQIGAMSITKGGSTPPGDYEYNIYRDGSPIATHVTTETYTDVTFDQYVGHEWEVRVVCEYGIESEGIFASKPKCNPEPCRPHIIGNGTTGQYYVPLNTWYRYSYTQEIFTEEELGYPDEGSNIFSVAFNFIRVNPATKTNQRYFLGQTTKTTFASTSDWEPLANLTEVVATKTITYNNSNTWFIVEFDAPYEYLGGNLVLAVLNNDGNYDESSPAFYAHSTTGNKSLYYYVDGSTPINPGTPPSGTLYANRANTNFFICGFGDCDPVENLQAKYNLFCSKATLTWEYEGFGGKSAGNSAGATTPTGNMAQMAPQTMEARLAARSEGGSNNSGASETNPTGKKPEEPTRAWPLVLQFSWSAAASITSSTAVATDGQFVYVGSWASSTITKLSMAGSVVGTFTIPGISTLRALTYDGTYFYGSTATSQIWKIDMNSQTIVSTINLANGIQARHCTYDPTADGGNGGFWVGNWTGTTYPDVIFQVSMTGAQLASIPAATHGLTSTYGTAFDNITPGGPYLWAIDADGGSGVPVTIRQINLTTGLQTGTSLDLSAAGLASVGGAGGGMFLAPTAFGQPTLMALVQNEWIHGWAFPCADCPAAPNPFTVTPVGTQLKANLAWTNPSTTFGGAPLPAGSITKIIIKREGVQIHEITSGITVGGAMTWQDATIPSAGKYCYSVCAVNAAGNGVGAEDCDIFGEVCTVDVIITSVTWGDDFYWIIKDDATGMPILGAGYSSPYGTGVSTGTFSTIFTGDATFEVWGDGWMNDNAVSLTIEVNGELVHSFTMYNIPYGLVDSAPLHCEVEGGIYFNIYRDTYLIAEYWDDIIYEDEDFDPWEGHEWAVTVICPDGYESKPMKVSLGKCSGECNPPENLTGEYAPDCSAITLNWEQPLPDGKKKSMFLGEDPEMGHGVGKEGMMGGSALTAANKVPGLVSKPAVYERGDWDSYADAYVFDAGAESYSSIDLPTGNTTPVTYMSSSLFPTGEDFDDSDIYRVYENNQVVKVADNGTTTNIGTISGLVGFAIGFAYDWMANDGSWYFTDIASGPGGYPPFTQYLYKITLPSLTKTLVGTIPASSTDNIYRGLTMGSDGFLYAVENNYYGNSNFVKIDKTTAQSTIIGSVGLSTWYGMDMEFDRQTGILYATLVNNNTAAGLYGTINTTTGTFTQIKNIGMYEQYASLVITKSGDLTVAKAPNPFTVQTFGSYLAAKLDWTNPTETLGGDPLTSIIKMVVERNGVTIKEYPGAAVGGTHSFMDEDIPSSGTYTYAVYAVTDAGNGAKASKTVTVGSICDLTFEMYDYYGDGWNGGSVGIQVNGVSYGTVTLSSGSYGVTSVMIPSGALELSWNPGSYDCECRFIVYDAYGATVYTSPMNGSYPCGTPGVGMYGISGSIYTGDIECPFFMEYMYNVYRDGDLLGSTEETTWTDSPIPVYWDHTWCVTVDCIGGGESVPTCIVMEGCMGNCEPIENLQAQYLNVQCETLLTWDEPIVGKAATGLQGPRETFGNGDKPIANIDDHADWCGTSSGITPVSPKAMWDVQFAFDAVAGAYPAVATDGVNFYTGNWQGTSPIFYRHNMDGSNPVGVSVSGVALVRSLTYDGTYFYGGNGGNSTIYKLDLANGTLIGTITSGAGNTRHLTYDPTLDGGNGGFWTGDWYNLAAISMTGAVLIANAATLEGCYGSAYDGINNCLWLNCQPNSDAWIYKYDIATGTVSPPIYNLNQDIPTGDGIGGGAFIYESGGLLLLAANVQVTPNRITVYEIGTTNTNIAKAPNPFTATAAGAFLACNLAWKNPTETIAGDPLTTIDEIYLYRGATQVGYWDNVYPGQNMSFSDNTIPSSGVYSYSVYAVTSEGNGQKANASAVIGDICTITVEMWDFYGDGWNGGVAVFQVDGVTWGSATIGSGNYATADILVPSGFLDILWTPGSYDCECEFAVYAPDGSVIYHSPTNGSYPCGTPGVGMYGLSGSVFTTDFECGNDMLIYRVYRDGVVVAPYVTETQYIDYGFNVFDGHTWCVTRVCGTDERESPERCTYLSSCGTCDPIENLIVTQPSEGEVHFCWTIPTPPGFLGIKIIRDGMVIAPLIAPPNLCYTDYVSVGDHLYCFIGIYDKPECTESEATCITINVFEQCDPVTNLEAIVISADKVKVTWMLSNALGVVDYSVYCDDELLGNTTQTFYIHEGVEPGEHIYCVVVNYNKPTVSCTESEPVCATVFVETCVKAENVTVTSATQTSITITWTAAADVETFDIYRDNNWIVNVDELTYTDEGTFAEGVIYQYCVIPVYHTCQVNPACADAYIEPCVPLDVTNVVATGNQEAKTATITWEYAGTDATFDLFKDGKFLANTANKNYTDNIEYDVIYKYCVAPVAECVGGAMACDTVLIDPIKGIIDPTTGLAIYPNPASTHVIIDGKEVVQVDIYNVVGQMVETLKSVEGESISKIDVSAYESGTYVFKIYTSDKAIITKPIVIRH